MQIATVATVVCKRSYEYLVYQNIYTLDSSIVLFLCIIKILQEKKIHWQARYAIIVAKWSVNKNNLLTNFHL